MQDLSLLAETLQDLIIDCLENDAVPTVEDIETTILAHLAKHSKPEVIAVLVDKKLILSCKGHNQAFAFNGDENIPAGLFIKWLVPEEKPNYEDMGYKPFSPNKDEQRRAFIRDGLAAAEAWAKTHEVTVCKPAKREAKPGITLEDLDL